MLILLLISFQIRDVMPIGTDFAVLTDLNTITYQNRQVVFSTNQFVSSFWADNKGLWLNIVNIDDQAEYSILANWDGEVLLRLPTYARYINVVEGKIYAPAFSPGYQTRYDWQAIPIEIHDFKGITTGAPFLKRHEIVREYDFDHKKHFVVKIMRGFLVMNQLENRMYIYGEEEIQRERTDGVGKFTPIQSREVHLTNWKKPYQFTPSKAVLPDSIFESERDQWYKSWSRIQGVFAVDEGFLVCYTIGQKMGWQLLAKNLQPIDYLESTFGVPAQNANGVFVFNDGCPTGCEVNFSH